MISKIRNNFDEDMREIGKEKKSTETYDATDSDG